MSVKKQKEKHYSLVCSDRLNNIVVGGKRTLPCFSASGLKSCVAIINPTSGCSHNCIFCYVNTLHVVKDSHSAHYTNQIVLYENLRNKLKYEMANKQDVEYGFFSTICDPFQHDEKILSITYKSMKHLLKNRKTVSFLTKGLIPLHFFDLFSHYINNNYATVTAQIGITTCDKKLSKILEPHATTPNRRLRQVQALNYINVNTSIRLDPLLPGITDTEEYISKLFSEVAKYNVKSCSVSYLMLHGPIRSNLYNCGDKRIEQMLNTFYAETTKVKVSGAGTNDVILTQYRLDKYAEIKKIGKKHGIEVQVCYCKNSDIMPEASDPQVSDKSLSCNIGNIWSSYNVVPKVCASVAQIEDLYKFDSSR